MKYQYWQGNKLLWSWHLTSRGQVLAHGEGYADKPAMLRAIEESKRSRPGDGNVPHGQRYRLSFMALVAVAVAGLLGWGALAIVAPRWDGSLVTVDADVVRMLSHGKGKSRKDYLVVRFDTLDGQSVTANIANETVSFAATTTRVRYPPGNPRDAMLDSTAIPYLYSINLLVGAAFFLWLAHKASLHDGQNHFM